MAASKTRPVDGGDVRFMIGCAVIAALSFAGAVVQRSPGILGGVLMAVMTVAVGAGTLRLMHVIRDL